MNSDSNAEEEAVTVKEPQPVPRRAKMAVPPKTPPGIELDNMGNQIPFEKRTEEDQEKARKNRRTE